MKTHTRRAFLIKGAAMAGSIALMSTHGAGILLAREDGAANKNMPRILVGYASESGSTTEVARFIGDRLSERGYRVHVEGIRNVDGIEAYDAIMLGSPIIYENWMPEVRSFVKNNREALKSKSVAYFMTCLALSSNKEDAKLKAVEYSDKLCKLVPEVKPLSVGRFGGVLDYSKISFVNRVLLKAALRKHPVKEGDYRDWEAIARWSDGLEFQWA